MKTYFKDDPFFKKLIHTSGIESFELCLSKMTYQEVEEGEVLMRYGEYGDKFYILLKGRMAVDVP